MSAGLLALSHAAVRAGSLGTSAGLRFGHLLRWESNAIGCVTS